MSDSLFVFFSGTAHFPADSPLLPTNTFGGMRRKELGAAAAELFLFLPLPLGSFGKARPTKPESSNSAQRGNKKDTKPTFTYVKITFSQSISRLALEHYF